MKKSLGLSAVVGSLLVFGNSWAAEHEAHVHGAAHMSLAVEGNEVKIELETPLANVLSFEHEPETNAQKEEVRHMAAAMRRADALFVLPAEAQCRLKEVSLESDRISDTLLSTKASGSAEKFPSGSSGSKDSHGDLDVEITFACSNPGKLNSIDVRLFGAFPNLRKVELRMVTPSGQRAAELSPGATVIRW